MLKVEGLNAGYGSVNILWDIGFEVKDGEIVAILGSNGAGKTTMVRTITGMVKASSGKVEFSHWVCGRRTDNWKGGFSILAIE